MHESFPFRPGTCVIGTPRVKILDMPFTARVFRVLIASPGDVHAERDLIEQVIHRWNADHSESNGVILLPQRWETNAVPEYGERPQGIINRQLVDGSDMIIGVFWTRIGSPTGDALSGTAEEIERGHTADKPVAIYFSERPAEVGTVDPEQLANLRELRARLQTQGLVSSFTEHSELERSVSSLLTRTARERFGAGSSIAVSTASEAVPKAVLRASLEKNYNARGHTTYRLVVRNVGSGMATQVTLEPMDETTAWRLVDAEAPIDFLPAGAEFGHVAAMSMQSARRVNYFLRWNNEDGSASEVPMTLTL